MTNAWFLHCGQCNTCGRGAYDRLTIRVAAAFLRQPHSKAVVAAVVQWVAVGSAKLPLDSQPHRQEPHSRQSFHAVHCGSVFHRKSCQQLRPFRTFAYSSRVEFPAESSAVSRSFGCWSIHWRQKRLQMM